MKVKAKYERGKIFVTGELTDVIYDISYMICPLYANYSM